MDLQVAWAAGFVDGEAHIGINRIRDRRVAGSDQRDWRLNPRITVGQTAIEPLDRLVAIFGGAVALRGAPTCLRHRRAWVWRLGGARQVRPALVAMLPMLTVKRAEAEVVIELCERLIAWKQGTRLSVVEIDARNLLSERLCAVKATGRGAPAVAA